MGITESGLLLWIQVQNKKLYSLLVCIAYRPSEIRVICLQNELVPKYIHALLAGKEEELASLVDCLDNTSAAFGMEISAEKTKLMTNNANGISIDIRINGEKLDEVDSFKYLGAVVTDQGSKPEVLSRIAQTTAALARLKTIWSDTAVSIIISICSKIKLMRSLVISVLLYACETWTLTADIL